VPHLWIREDLSVGRSLKTPNSERRVPLVGMALWGAEVALRQRSAAQTWVFPRYAEDHNIRATHASNTINKWLWAATGTRKTAHSFRHAMRDRSR
jgi:integrase